MKNNIFDFATSELSQDAFICWCVNWFNDGSRPELGRMAVDLLRRLSGAEEIERVEIFRQFSQKAVIVNEGAKEKVALKIDVLLIVNGNTAVIIEDKTYSGEHDDQIARYKAGLASLAAGSGGSGEFAGVERVRTVYLKTGFMYDGDKLVKADLVITGGTLLEILSPYEGSSEILDSYIARLRWLREWYAVHGRYDETGASSFWDWNIARHHIAQYRLMRDIFPEAEWWTDRGSRDYMVYHGSSYGRPWTQAHIFERTYEGTADGYAVFWRIDTDNDGPYISLRFYEDFDKNDAARKERHRRTYVEMKGEIRGIVEGHPDLFYFVWDRSVDPGNCGGYKESALIHLNLKDKLENWSAEGEGVIRSVRELTRLFSGKAV